MFPQEGSGAITEATQEVRSPGVPRQQLGWNADLWNGLFSLGSYLGWEVLYHLVPRTCVPFTKALIA